MLFTNYNLNIIEIKRMDYKCDTDYYKAILKCKGLYIAKNAKNRILHNLKFD